MIRIVKTTWLVMAVVIISCGVSHAALYRETWTNSVAGWQMKTYDEATPAYGTNTWYTGSPWDGREEILRIEASPASGIKQDIIYADATADGDMVPTSLPPAGSWIEFDFYANMAPTRLDAYFKGNGVLWRNEITSVTVGSWASYNVGLNYNEGAGWLRWDGTGETAADFGSSLASMTEVGIIIWYQDGVPGQDYGLDNFSIVPEPEVILLLGAALLSIAVTFKRQIGESMADIKVRLNI